MKESSDPQTTHGHGAGKVSCVRIPSTTIAFHGLAWGLVWSVLYFDVPVAKYIANRANVAVPKYSVIIFMISDFFVVNWWIAPFILFLFLCYMVWRLFSLRDMRMTRDLRMHLLHYIVVLIPILALWMMAHALFELYANIVISYAWNST